MGSAEAARPPFIVFEGPDGSGKTTQVERLAAALRGRGAVVVTTRDPGGTAIGEQVRALLLDPSGCAILAPAEALLYAAARAQLVGEVIRPSLASGAIVLCDRYVDSSLVYQGVARGLSVEAVAAIQPLATGGLLPDLRILLDVPVALGTARRLASGEVNRLDAERESFHRRVRRGFLDLAAASPNEWLTVDGRDAPDAVAAVIDSFVRRRFEGRLGAAMDVGIR